MIRGFAILKLQTDEKGFHDGDVWGPFSFAHLLSVLVYFLPERLVESLQVVRNPFAEGLPVPSGKIHRQCLFGNGLVHADRSVVGRPGKSVTLRTTWLSANGAIDEIEPLITAKRAEAWLLNCSVPDVAIRVGE